MVVSLPSSLAYPLPLLIEMTWIHEEMILCVEIPEGIR